MVELRGVSVVLGNKKILQDVTWTIRRGENWALIGPNGSGKTTLLRVINGYLWPSKGVISVLGKTFGSCDLRELRKSIGFVSSYITEQIPVDLPVLEVVLSGSTSNIGGVYAKLSKAELRRAGWLLRSVGCGNLAEKLYGNLSHGQRQRVSIARALMSSPQLLTLDEPCSGLDLSAREHFLKLVQKMSVATRRPTIILATHRVEEIVPAFTHTIMIKEGKIVASGSNRITLTSRNISKAFSVNAHLMKRNGRYHSLVG